jgi:hypothetical protein
MRKVLITAALVAAALGGVAACGTTPAASTSSSPSTNGSAAPTTAVAADETKDVCTQAIALEQQNGKQVLAKVQQAIADSAAGKTVDFTQLEADLTAIQQSWVTAFQGFSARNIKPGVKIAIDNFITFLQTLNQSSQDTLTTVTTKFNELDQALVAACA